MSSAIRRLGLVHLPANALLLWLGYEWLGVGESTGMRLAWSVIDALAIVALACWLYGATFVFFRTPAEERKLNEAFRTALRHLAPLVLMALVVLAVYGGLEWAKGAVKLRKPAAFLAGLWILRWIVLPVGLLPMFSGIAARGWRGIGEFTWRWNWRAWLAVPALLALGLMLPPVVIDWVPRAGGFAMEMVSFSLRAGFAYLLFVGAWVALAAFGARAVNSPRAAPHDR